MGRVTSTSGWKKTLHRNNRHNVHSQAPAAWVATSPDQDKTFVRNSPGLCLCSLSRNLREREVCQKHNGIFQEDRHAGTLSQTEEEWSISVSGLLEGRRIIRPSLRIQGEKVWQCL